MALSDELISRLVKVTNDRGNENRDYTIYGTVVTEGTDSNKRNYVRLDGSELLTPFESTVEVGDGDRVIVEVKNHIATVTGSTTNPATGVKRAGNIESSITQTASEIRSEVKTLEDNLSSSITQTADSIRSEVSAKFDTTNTNVSNLDDKIDNVNSDLDDRITSVNNTLAARLTAAESSITQTATSIRSEVSAKFDTTNTNVSNLGTEIDTVERTLARRISHAESSITQTATSIRSEVKASFNTTNANVSNLDDKIDNVNSDLDERIKSNHNALADLNTAVNGSNGLAARLTSAESSIRQFPDTIVSTVKAEFIDDKTDEQGHTTKGWGSLLSTMSDDVDDLDDRVSSAEDDISSLDTAINGTNGLKTKYTKLVQDFEGFSFEDEEGTVMIDGGNIHLGGCLTVYESTYILDKKGKPTEESITPGGYLGYDDGFNSSEGIGVRDATGISQMVCTDEAARLSHGNPSEECDYAQVVAGYDDDNETYNISLDAYDYVYLKHNGTVVARTYNDGKYNMFIPGSDDEVYLGKKSHYWAAAYATNYFGSVATATGSDRNLKNSIEDIPDKYVEMFDRLRPVRYKLNSGTSDRYHVGYIAQEVEEAMTAVGIDSQEFGGLVKDKNEDGSHTYMLRYGEFDAIRDAKIKQLEARNAELEARIEKLEKLLTQNT